VTGGVRQPPCPPGRTALDSELLYIKLDSELLYIKLDSELLYIKRWLTSEARDPRQLTKSSAVVPDRYRFCTRKSFY